MSRTARNIVLFAALSVSPAFGLVAPACGQTASLVKDIRLDHRTVPIPAPLSLSDVHMRYTPFRKGSNHVRACDSLVLNLKGQLIHPIYVIWAWPCLGDIQNRGKRNFASPK